jgi:hypothetical protein
MDIKQKRQKFNTLLYYGQMRDAKEHILSGMGVKSTTELSEKQLDQVIDRVQRIVDERQSTQDKQVREWRHKCLLMVNACGIDTKDWNAVNAFMLDKRISGKHLYELTQTELVELHRKLHNVKANKDKKQAEINRLKTSN